MAAHHGKSGVVYMSTTGTGVATNVIKLNAFTVNRTTDKVEVTAFGDLNKTYVQGLPDLSITFSGVWDDAESKPFTAAASSDGCKLYLYPDANAPTKFWSGPAWLEVSMETGVSAAVTISGTASANGSWANTF